MANVGILIPAYNESEKIGEVVSEIKSMGYSPVVVDDGSTDMTAKTAEAAGATVLCHAKNMGKGYSLRTGIEFMLSKGYDYVLTMDGDGQHSAADIRKFVDAAGLRRDVMVVGNRMSNTKNMPADRKFTNMFMSLVISMLCGQRVPDSQCGFRLIQKGLLEKVKIESGRFEVESELLIKVSRAGGKILSVPIDTRYGKELSQINPFLDTLRFIWFLLRLPFIKKSR